MASGSYTKKSEIRFSAQTRSTIPARATRLFADEIIEDIQVDSNIGALRIDTNWLPFQSMRKLASGRLTVSVVCIILCAIVLCSLVLSQRPTSPELISYVGGQVYTMQVGGDRAATWQQSRPQPVVNAPAVSNSSYSVLSAPTISADFINRVLAIYNSPAAGKGQSLYDMGVKYGIDPAFALAFFMHESSFGVQGEAQASLSLGNLRCIPNFKCQDGYAWFTTWEDGFQAWYELIRNLYVSQWGLTTVNQIIPKYAPTADNNDETAYIASVEHAINTWRAGILQP
jgi:Mannosyl-glycoprotein endo-beta-N-acetylglucosaminidase